MGRGEFRRIIPVTAGSAARVVGAVVRGYAGKLVRRLSRSNAGYAPDQNCRTGCQTTAKPHRPRPSTWAKLTRCGGTLSKMAPTCFSERPDISEVPPKRFKNHEGWRPSPGAFDPGLPTLGEPALRPSMC